MAPPHGQTQQLTLRKRKKDPHQRRPIHTTLKLGTLKVLDLAVEDNSRMNSRNDVVDRLVWEWAEREGIDPSSLV